MVNEIDGRILWKFTNRRKLQIVGKFCHEHTGSATKYCRGRARFSKVNLNKTKLRNALGTKTLESIIVTGENFKENFEIDQNLRVMHSQARTKYFAKYLDAERNDVDEDFD